MSRLAEALLIVLDVSLDRTTRPAAFAQTLRAAEELIKQRLLFAPKGLTVAVVLSGTSQTRNRLHAPGQRGYEHVTVLREFRPPDIGLVRALADEALPETGSPADVLDALIVGLDLLVHHAEPRAQKRIFLVTDAGSPCSPDGIDKVVDKFNELDVKLNVIGVDFSDDDEEEDDDDDEEEEEKESKAKEKLRKAALAAANASSASVKSANEKLLRSIAARVSGAVWPIRNALALLTAMRSKSVLLRSSSRPIFSLAPICSIPVHVFVKTKETSFPTLVKQSVVAMEAAAESSDESEEGESRQIESESQSQIRQQQKRARLRAPGRFLVERESNYYRVTEPDEPVPAEYRTRAYKYGKNIVPFGSVHAGQMRYQSSKCLELLGFFDKASLPRSWYMKSVDIVVPAPGDDYAPTALGALFSVLFETNRAAICRYVRQLNAEPQLVCLVAQIVRGDDDNIDKMLCMNTLPFHESRRELTLPSLDVYNGQMDEKLRPSDDQLDAMKEYIETLDLMNVPVTDAAHIADEDDQGNPVENGEAYKPELTCNPVLQYFYQCVQHRAIHPEDPLPPVAAEIMEMIKPPASLASKRDQAAAKLAAAFVLEKLEEKKTAGKRDAWQAGLVQSDVQLDSYLQPSKDGEDVDAVEEDNVAPISIAGNGITLSGLAMANGVDSINTITPVADFQAMLKRRDVDLVDKAIREMCAYIEKVVVGAMGDMFYAKALECVRTLRQGCKQTSIGESTTFNRWLRRVRSQWENNLADDFWQLLVASGISLISTDEADDADASPSDSRAFLEAPADSLPLDDLPPIVDEDEEPDELEDLLADAD